MKELTRNTDVQINEKIDKLTEKKFRMITVKMIRNLEHTWKKCKNQLTKT